MGNSKIPELAAMITAIKDSKKQDYLNQLYSNERFIALLNEISVPLFEQQKNELYRRSHLNRLDSGEMLITIHKVWGEAFTSLDGLYIYLWDEIVKHRNAVDMSEHFDMKHVFFALDRNVGRCFQVFMEILCLLKGGFPDGAYARWRTLSELCVVSDFIASNGEEVATEYCHSSNLENNWAKKAACFQTKKYKSKKRISTYDLYMHSNYKHKSWYQQFGDASLAVHAQKEGIFSQLGKPGVFSNSIAPGETLFGMESPAVLTASSICHLVNTYFRLYPTPDNLVVINCAYMWLQHIERLIEVILEFIKDNFPEAYIESEKRPHNLDTIFDTIT